MENGTLFFFYTLQHYKTSIKCTAKSFVLLCLLYIFNKSTDSKVPLAITVTSICHHQRKRHQKKRHQRRRCDEGMLTSIAGPEIIGLPPAKDPETVSTALYVVISLLSTIHATMGTFGALTRQVPVLIVLHFSINTYPSRAPQTVNVGREFMLESHICV